MKSFCVLLIFIVVESSVGVKLPENYKRCKISDDDCLNDAIQDVIGKITKEGIPQLNIPILDPIDIPSMEFGTNGNVVNVLQKYHNVKLRGLRQAVVSKSHVDLDKNFITFVTKLPFLIQEADYDINGKILVVPIVGKGRSVYKQVNSTVVHTIHFDKKTEKQNEYFKVKSYSFEVTIERLIFQLDNLFDGNKELSDRIHAVLNENWDAVWEETKPDFQEAYGLILANYARRVFDKIPISQIFL